LVETAAASGASGGGGGGGAADVRILNVASISQTSKIDFDNLECEKSFSNHASYCHSKTMMKLFSFELYERVAAAAAKGGEPSPLRDVAVLACDPGTVNTKMLLAGWGPCGIETFEANDQFELLTRERFGNASVPESERGGYYVNRTLRETPGGVELEDRKRLWEILERETGVTYPLL
jgi:NAD(P)-dependent dehydrogenase (short-subunit alcohol dehydrogenase family)